MDPEYLWYRLHGTIENARTSYGGPAIEPQYLRPRWLAPQAFLRLPGTASPSSRAGSVLESSSSDLCEYVSLFVPTCMTLTITNSLHD